MAAQRIRATGLFTAIVAFTIAVFFLCLIAAISLSIFADTSLKEVTATGETIKTDTMVGDAIERLWLLCSGSFGILTGIITGKLTS